MGKIAWVSDLHIKPAAALRRHVIGGDAFVALTLLAKDLQREKVDAVVLGGDVFDNNNPDGESQNAFQKFREDVGVPVYFIQGNHDKNNPHPSVPQHAKPAHRILEAFGCIPIDKRLCTIAGMRVYGIDYRNRILLHEALKEVPECDLLCVHAAFKHLLAFENAFDLEEKDVPETVKRFVLAGDVHTQQSKILPDKREIISSGSLYTWRIDEGNRAHGYAIVEKDDEGNISNTFRQIAHRKVYYVDTVDTVPTDDLLAAPALRKPIVIFKFDEKLLVGHPAREKAVWLPSDELSAEMDIPEEREGGTFDCSLLGTLPDEVDKDVYPEVFSLVESLLKSRSPRQELESWLTSKGVVLS